MSWLALLLIGVAATDLGFSVRPGRWWPQGLAATVVVVLGLLAGLTDAVDLAALLVLAAVVLLWGWSVTRGFGGGPAWLPLGVFAGALLVAVAVAGWAGEVAGPLGRWVESSPIVGGTSPEEFLLLLGVFGVQLSTGNVLVRLVLTATGTLHAVRDAPPSGPETRLKGGRLLGPLERVFIVALALAGQVTAASIVVAAKGLLRFPELSSRREQERIHRLTEYFLLGSFLSWLVALGGVALVAAT